MMNKRPFGGEGKENLFFGASTEDGFSTLQNDYAQENIHSNPQDKSTSQNLHPSLNYS
jgi:hypothetical protein